MSFDDFKQNLAQFFGIFNSHSKRRQKESSFVLSVIMFWIKAVIT